MIRCLISRWNPERRFERVSEPLYAAVPAAGSYVHFRLEGVRDMEVARVVDIEYHPGSDPVVWVVPKSQEELGRMLEMKRWHDTMVAEFMQESGSSRPSTMTSLELMLWHSRRIEAEREKHSSGTSTEREVKP